MRYPVHYQIDRPQHFTRLQLLVRFVAFLALGILGVSFGTIFLFGYFALPVFASTRVHAHGAEAYLREDSPRVVRGLRWFAAVSAWAGLTSDRLPSSDPDETVSLDVEPSASPTPSSAIWRVVTGIPSALVLGVLGMIGWVVWLWGALSILVTGHVGELAFHYLVGLQRWSVRLLAYQASLVDAYPPFAFTDALPALPAARATP